MPFLMHYEILIVFLSGCREGFGAFGVVRAEGAVDNYPTI